jgi:hypothetical protein
MGWLTEGSIIQWLGRVFGTISYIQNSSLVALGSSHSVNNNIKLINIRYCNHTSLGIITIFMKCGHKEKPSRAVPGLQMFPLYFKI